MEFKINIRNLKEKGLIISSFLVFGISFVVQHILGDKVALYSTFNGSLSNPGSTEGGFSHTPFGVFTFGSSIYFAVLFYAFLSKRETEVKKLTNAFHVLLLVSGLLISLLDTVLWSLVTPIKYHLNHTFFILFRFAIMAISALGISFIAFVYWDRKNEKRGINKLIDCAVYAETDPNFYHVLYDRAYLDEINKSHLLFESEEMIEDTFNAATFRKIYDAHDHARNIVQGFIDDNIDEDAAIFDQPLWKQLSEQDYKGPLPVILGKGNRIFFPSEFAYGLLTNYFDRDLARNSYHKKYGFFILKNVKKREISIIENLRIDCNYDHITIRTLVPNFELEDEIIREIELELDSGEPLMDVIQNFLEKKGYLEGDGWDFVRGNGFVLPTTLLD